MNDKPTFTACTDTDAHPRDEFKLAPLQRAFCDRYLDNIGEGVVRGIKKRSALEAGYSPTDAANAATRNLRHPSCVAYIASQMAAATAKVPIDRSFVLFKAVLCVERSEAAGNEMAVMRALELIARHQDVAALVHGRGGDDDGGNAGLSLPFDLSKLSTDEKRQLLDLVQLATPGNASRGTGGGVAALDSRGRSESEAGQPQP